MAFDDLVPNQPQVPPGFENVQLGFVETFFPPVDPAFQKP